MTDQSPQSSIDTTLKFDHLLAQMVEAGASDLHLGAGSPPALRIDGKIRRLDCSQLPSPESMHAVLDTILDIEQRAVFEQRHDLDLAYSLSGVGRFRINVMRRRGSIAVVARHIPHEIPTGAQLGLPIACRTLAERPRGLVLVTGPTGSGKSTTLAALIDYVNSNVEGHILTLEDPVEFIHRDKQCIITQRQIGHDTENFNQGLRSGLRQDPDIIMIGELRDLETVQLAITAAETGHLVFGTLHTTSAIATVDRIIDVFPHESQQQVRIQLAQTLQGVISQCLVPRVGGGRIAAHEILISTDGVRSLIRESKSAQILNVLQTGRALGMTSLEDRLSELVAEGHVQLHDALRVANRPADIERKLATPAP